MTTSTPATLSAAVRFQALQYRLAGWLSRHSITLLRMSLGVVFLIFGILKFFPGASPAEALVQQTIGTLSFGLISPSLAMIITAVLETTIGVTMLTGKFLRFGVLVLFGALAGIMSPLVLFIPQMFPAPTFMPTLEAQYVIKDLILVGAGLVVAAKALGSKLVPQRNDQVKDDQVLAA